MTRFGTLLQIAMIKHQVNVAAALVKNVANKCKARIYNNAST